MGKLIDTDGLKQFGKAAINPIKQRQATYEQTTALNAHAVDDFIYLNEVVYRVTSAIAAGDTIVTTGNNANVTADTGLDVGSQIYVKGLPGDGGGSSGGIDSSMIAGTESTSASTHAYSTGDYFIDSQGQLCKATDDIAINDTISVGTGSGNNAVATTVGGELTELNSNIGGITYGTTNFDTIFWRKSGNIVIINVVNYIGTGAFQGITGIPTPAICGSLTQDQLYGGGFTSQDSSPVNANIYSYNGSIKILSPNNQRTYGTFVYISAT